MTPRDVLSAVGLSLALLVVNVLISVLVIVVYSYGIEPGHDEAFYEAAAQRIAPWSSVVFGGPLFFAGAGWQARRRPDRDALAYAVTCVASYAVVDVSVLIAAGGTTSDAGIVTLSLLTKLVGALIGAKVFSAL
jgi:hypothetical protein